METGDLTKYWYGYYGPEVFHFGGRAGAEWVCVCHADAATSLAQTQMSSHYDALGLFVNPKLLGWCSGHDISTTLFSATPHPIFWGVTI